MVFAESVGFLQLLLQRLMIRPCRTIDREVIRAFEESGVR